jgi:transcription elongation factor GreA
VTYVTAEGLEKLKDELRERKEIKRVEIAERLDKAIKMGDLKENADYHVAKEDQAFNEGRIQQLNDAIFSAVVIEERKAGKTVRIGNTVTIAEEGYEDEEEEYRIVGAREADPVAGMISNESPIGKALIGAKLGEVVEANTPGGLMRFKILKVS